MEDNSINFVFVGRRECMQDGSSVPSSFSSEQKMREVECGLTCVSLSPPVARRSGTSGQFGGSSGECAYMLTYRLHTPTPSDSPLPAVSIPGNPILEKPTVGREGNAVDLDAAPAPEPHCTPLEGLVGASLWPPAATHPGGGERRGWSEKGTVAAVSDTREEAPNGAAAASSELLESRGVAEGRDGDLGMRSRGGSGEGVEKNGSAEGEMDGKLLPRTMLAMPLPLHLQTLVHEANEELRRWEGSGCSMFHGE